MEFARVAELEDARALGARPQRGVGSTPTPRTARQGEQSSRGAFHRRGTIRGNTGCPGVPPDNELANESVFAAALARNRLGNGMFAVAIANSLRV